MVDRPHIVYVVHPVREDLGAAKLWGKLRYVNEHYVYGDELTDDNELPFHIVANMQRHAGQFDPRHDYLLIVGDHAQLVAFSVQLAVRYKAFSVLRYDRLQGAYFVIRIGGRKNERRRSYDVCRPAAP